MHGKAIGNSLGGPESSLGWGLRETVCAKLIEAQMWHSSGGKAHQRNNSRCQHFCLGENCPPSSHPNAGKFSSYLYFSAAGPLKGTAGTPAKTCLPQPNPHLVLQPEIMGTSLPGPGILGWGAWCGAGIPHSSRGTSAAKVYLPIFICYL